MKTRLFAVCFIISFAAIQIAFSQASPNPQLRLFGYLPAWGLQMGTAISGGSSNYENCLYTNIDWDACTDYVLFNVSFDQNGKIPTAYDWGTARNDAWGNPYFQLCKRRYLNDYIHARGKAVHLCFFVSSGTGAEWSTLLSSASGRNAMIRTIVDSVIGPTNRYDGVNFDIEPMLQQDTANARIFFAQLRDTLNQYHQWADPSKKSEVSICFFDQWGQSSYWASVSQYLDGIHHMSYNMMGSWETVTWYNAPVYQTGYTSGNYNVQSIDGYVQSFVNTAHIPRNKLVMACPFNYNAFQGGITSGGEGAYAPLLSMTTFPDWKLIQPNTRQLVGGNAGSEMYYLLWEQYLDTATTTVHYDDVRKAAWLGENLPGSANDLMIGFEDTACVRENLQYAASQGIQGSMIWEVTGAYCNNLPNPRHPTLPPDHLLQAAKRTRLALLGVSFITAAPTTLAFGNVNAGATLDSLFFVSGANLSPAGGNLSITAPSGFQVSQTRGTGFGSSLSVSYANGYLSAVPIYVRFAPTAVQAYSGNLTVTGGGAALQNIALSGTGRTVAAPAVSVNPTSLSFGNVTVNTTSNEQTYTVSGAYLVPLSGTISITAPPGFLVSKTNGTGFGASLSIPYTNGTLAAYTVHVNFTPTAVQSYSGIAVNSGGGATAKNVAFSGNGVSAGTSILTVIPSSFDFGSILVNTISGTKSYLLTGANLTPSSGTLTITAPTGFQISRTNGSGFGNSLSIQYSGGLLLAQTIYIRFAPTLLQTYTGSVTNAGGGAATAGVTLGGIGVSTAGSLTANPQILPVGGGPVMLSWRAQNADSVTIVPDIGRVALIDSTTVTVTSTKTFVLTLFSRGVNAFQCSVIVVVKQPPTGTLTASPQVLPLGGGDATLTWNSQNADSAFIDPDIGPVPPSGSLTVNVSSTKAFTLTLFSDSEPLRYRVVVTVLSKKDIQLGQNYPNPFNPDTKIPFSLPSSGHVNLSIYNMLGQRIATLIDEDMKAGFYQRAFNISRITWKEVASGVYFYRLDVDGVSITRRLMLVK